MKPAVLSLALSLALVASAQTDLEAQVDAYLGSLDAAVKAEQWRALGPDAIALLEKRAFAKDGLPTVRARAAEALGLVGGEAQGEPLLAVATQADAPLIVRLSALRGAGRVLSNERAAKALAPLLEKDPNPKVRATAADVLAERLGAPGCAMAQKQAQAEPASQKTFFSSALKRCEKPKP